MKIVFFDIKDWEIPVVKALSSNKNLIVVFFESPFELEKTPPDTDILSISRLYPRIDSYAIDRLKNLKLIAARTSGIDHIDVDYAKTKGIAVSNVPDYSTIAAAEYTFCLILSLTRKLKKILFNISQGDFTRNEITGSELFGKTIGIIGTGRIGTKVATIAHGFGMNILCFSRSIKKELVKKYNAEYVELKDLLKNSDVITLHLPYNAETHHFIGYHNIKNLKEDSILINTSRGSVVCLKALADALKQDLISGAALDTFEGEEFLLNRVVAFEKGDIIYEISQMPNVIITPHNAFNSCESQTRLIKATVDNILSFIVR